MRKHISFLYIGVLLFGSTVLCAQTDTDTVDEDDIEEVVVVGVKASLQQSLDRKRESNQIIEVITAEDVGKLPDQNVAEALQRVSGVSITRGENISVGDSDGAGEGSLVSIRGTAPAQSRATINGQTIGNTSSQGGGRAFNFNTISPEMVEALEVFKTPSAHQDEGSLGGSVNLITRSPLKFKKRTVTLGAKLSSNILADDGGSDLSFLYAEPLLEGRLGFLVNYNSSAQPFRRDSIESFGWQPIGWNETDKTIINSSAVLAGTTTNNRVHGFIPRDFRQNIRQEDRDRFGLNFVLQYRPSDNLDLKLDFFQTGLERHDLSSNNVFRFPQAPGGLGATRIETLALQGNTFVQAEGARGGATHYRNFWAVFDRTFNRETDALTLSLDWQMNAQWNLVAKVGQSEGKGTQDPSLFANYRLYATTQFYTVSGGEVTRLGSGNSTDYASSAVQADGRWLNSLSRPHAV